MSALDLDLRIRIVNAYQNGEGSLREVAARFAVSAGVVAKLNTQFQETGCLKARTATNHGVRKVTAEVDEKLRRHLRDNPDATLEELREQVKDVKAVSTISRNLKRLGLTNKKNA